MSGRYVRQITECVRTIICGIWRPEEIVASAGCEMGNRSGEVNYEDKKQNSAAVIGFVLNTYDRHSSSGERIRDICATRACGEPER